MTATKTTIPAPTHASPAGEAEQTPDLFSRIASIDRRSLPPRERAEEFLKALSESLGFIATTISIGITGDEFDLRETQDRDGLAPWIGTLQNAALEARSHSRSIARVYGKDAANPEYAVIACPIDSAGRDPFGGVAGLVRCRESANAERLKLHLRSACLQAAGVLAKPAKTKSRGVEMSDVARVFTKAGQYTSVHEFAFAITNAARQRFNCDLAAMGSVSGGKVRLLCISGLDQIKKRSPGVRAIEQAMGECLDAGTPLIAQRQDSWNDSEAAQTGALHERWRLSTNGAAVLSLPIHAGDPASPDSAVAAVVSFRRAADQPFDADDIEAARKLLAPLAGAVPLVARATRSLPAHASIAASDAARWAVAPRSLRKKAVAAAAIAGAAWFATASSHYRISTPAAVVAEREHVIASPAGAIVSSVLARAGQRVNAGDTLATLDTAELRLERAELAAEIDSAALRLAASIAENDPAQASIAKAEQSSLATRLLAVEDRIDRSVITAPVAGIVIGQELADLRGRRVAEGEPLLTIAEAGSLSLELRVPESRVADLEPGVPVRFASHSRPETPGHTTLARIAPAAVQREGSPVFLGEATLPDDLDWLRPGMEGVASIDAGEKPNWWIATHRIIDTARLNFWID